MKFLILAENAREPYLHYHYRNTAANELRRRINQAGYEAEIIEWIRHWNKSDIIKIIDLYFADEPNPVIAVSSTFDMTNSDLKYLNPIFSYAKTKFKNLKIIHGGNRMYTKLHYNPYVDVEFLGRSMGMFDAWIRDKDLSLYKKMERNGTTVLSNDNIDKIIDNPITYTLNHSDCLNKNDFLGFEMAVGCRFNCPFCNYELRGSKTIYLNDSKRLKDFFDEAYNKYGVENFYAIDDTINESEEKLEALYKAIEGLNFKPKITAYARLDLLGKEYQREFFKKINFSSLWFGIESFNPDVSKQVRKKSSMENVFDNLVFIRDNCPETFTIGSFIIGLNGDNAESIDQGFQKVYEEKLLHSLQIFSLSIGNETLVSDSLSSELTKYPEKFGYKVYFDSKSPLIWESDWTNNLEAVRISGMLTRKWSNKFFMITHSEGASFQAMGLLKNNKFTDTEILKNKALVLSNLYKQEYIKRKKALFNLV